jgi:hypothetical protein
MPVPVEKSAAGCYLKIQFPQDFALPDPTDADLALAYQSMPGSVMSNAEGGANLDAGKQVETSHQEFKSDGTGNTLIIQGCTAVAGEALTTRI